MTDALEGDCGQFEKLGGFRDGKLVGYCEYYAIFDGAVYGDFVHISCLLVQEQSEQTNLLSAFCQHIQAQHPLPVAYLAV